MSLKLDFICLSLFLFVVSVISWRIEFNVSDKIAENPRGNKQIGPTIVYPGTKWCGNGNVAENYDDLGKYTETDACCREHDHCKDVIEAMETKYNLTNSALYTRVHCSCDEKFYDCLQESVDEAGSRIGILYFSILDTKCFRKDHPIRSCKRYSRFPRRCLEYELNEEGQTIHQWFDVPPFKE